MITHSRLLTITLGSQWRAHVLTIVFVIRMPREAHARLPKAELEQTGGAAGRHLLQRRAR